jgi:hypothetical protein
MDNGTKATLFLIAIISLFLAGCAAQQASERKLTVQTREKTPEESLVGQISDGRIVEIYEEFIRLSPGESKDNWLIIKNAKEWKETFTIQPCQGCSFDTTTATIEPGRYEIIRFVLNASEGQKEIKVKDSLNNAYGYAKISVIIE